MRQPVPDAKSTSQEWKPNPQVIMKHDDLYTGAWECEFESPKFDKPGIPSSSDFAVPSDSPIDQRVPFQEP